MFWGQAYIEPPETLQPQSFLYLTSQVVACYLCHPITQSRKIGTRATNLKTEINECHCTAAQRFVNMVIWQTGDVNKKGPKIEAWVTSLDTLNRLGKSDASLTQRHWSQYDVRWSHPNSWQWRYHPRPSTCSFTSIIPHETQLAIRSDFTKSINFF